MKTPKERQELEDLAEEVFELSQLSSRARTRSETDANAASLSEAETLTLDLLVKNEVMSVGQIQKRIGVLPAQMSRIVRSLEDKSGEVMIRCKINARDRRKIDVSITDAGQKAVAAYRAARLGMTVDVLSILTSQERGEFMRILRKMRRHISNNLGGK